MPTSPEPTTSARLRAIRHTMGGVRQELTDLRGHLSMQVDGKPLSAPVEGFARAPVPGHEGMFWSLLPPPAMALGTYSHMVVCGMQGARYPRTSLPHALRICVLAGSLLWTQDSTGPESRHVGPGQHVDVAPGEEYGYTILEDYTGYLTFSPAL